ncbi:MAG: uroporphyrinogen decarboxylase family protein [Armatimonadota bacterium]
MNSKERFHNALFGEPVDRVPVFPLLMFLAARHAGISYREFAASGSSLAEAQLLMREKFPLDAITACSDAFRLAADLGGDVAYPEEGTPHLIRPLITDESTFRSLVRPDPLKGRMRDRVDGVRMMAESAGSECAVLGWVEMPYAEASALTGVADFMLLALEKPELAHEILRWITDIEIDFALAQIDAGADMIGAGDAAASLISPAMYSEFALPYEQMVADTIHNAGKPVKLHICGNTRNHLPFMAQCGADLYNVDHMVPFIEARDVYLNVGACFKGNMDPVTDILDSTPEQCEHRAHELICLAEGSRYMLSAGCEIPKDTPDEVFAAFCNAPQTYKSE